MTHGLTDKSDPHIWERLGLGGATQQIAYADPEDCREAVTKLMTDGHGHHFAVVGEGRQLVCSPMAVKCLLPWLEEEEVS